MRYLNIIILIIFLASRFISVAQDACIDTFITVDSTLRVDTIIVDNQPVVENQNCFKAEQVVLPATLIAVGAIGLASDDFRSSTSFYGAPGAHGETILQFAPGATYFALGFTGLGKHRTRERRAIGITAAVVCTAITGLGKLIINEPRPVIDGNDSFPSGHTARAFTGAELLRMEYGWAWGLGGYAIASYVGYCRIANGHHWLTDVVAGAGVGILSARIGYWLLPVVKKVLRWDDSPTAPIAVAIPTFSPATKTVSLAIAVEF